MRSLDDFRSGKPGFYPDQSVYAEYACAEFGLAFVDLDSGSGLLFSVTANGRLSWVRSTTTCSTFADIRMTPSSSARLNSAR